MTWILREPVVLSANKEAGIVKCSGLDACMKEHIESTHQGTITIEDASVDDVIDHLVVHYRELLENGYLNTADLLFYKMLMIYLENVPVLGWIMGHLAYNRFFKKYGLDDIRFQTEEDG